MKFITVALAVLSFGQTEAANSESPLLAELSLGVKEHPIGNVVKLLQELKGTAEEEGEAEAKAYQKFKNWCDNSKEELDNAVKEGKDDIETLEASVSAKKKLISTLEADIEFLTKQLEEQTVSGDEAKKIREDTLKAYEDADKDYDSTIEAVEECIKALKKTKDETSLVSTKSVRKVLALAEGLVSSKEQEMLASLLAMSGPPGYKKPEDKEYTFKSGSVIELLESLKEKFEMDKEEATKAETASLNAYNVAKGARDDALEAAEKAKEEKTTLKGEAETELAEKESSLSEAKEDLAANEKTLEKTTADCDLKADEWSERKKMRAGEIKAIKTAIEILSKVLGVRAPKDLMQKAVSFLQIDRIDSPKAKAMKILVSEAQKVHSKALQKLIDQIKLHKEGPFDQINQMIQKMIFQLMAEQKDEDDHKNWCDTETEKAEGQKEHNDQKKEELELKIEDGESKTQELVEEIEEHNDEVTKLTTSIKEATDIRNEEHEENMAAIKDAQDAQAALSKAIAVLSEYYEKAAKGFIQTGQRGPVELPESPETWDASYTGVSDPNAQPDGIVAVLEKTSEDYSKMEADTKAQEASDQKAYDEELTTNTIDKAEHEKSIEMKTHAKARLQDKLNNWRGQKKHVIAELEAAEGYLKKLEGACAEGDMTYEDRKKARTDEIEALREAQNILTDAFKDAKFLQKKVSVKSHQ